MDIWEHLRESRLLVANFQPEKFTVPLNYFHGPTVIWGFLSAIQQKKELADRNGGVLPHNGRPLRILLHSHLAPARTQNPREVIDWEAVRQELAAGPRALDTQEPILMREKPTKMQRFAAEMDWAELDLYDEHGNPLEIPEDELPEEMQAQRKKAASLAASAAEAQSQESVVD